MTEGSPIPQEPQALNHQLIALYDLLPRRDQRFVKTEPIPAMKLFGIPGGKWRIPKNSELKTRITARINELLPQAHITPSFQQVLIASFKELCDYGTWKEIEPDDDNMRRLRGDKLHDEMQKDFVYDTVIATSMDGGGIFDPSDAMRVERIAYRREFLILSSINEAKARLHRYLNRDKGINGEYVPDPNTPIAQRFQKWREEFISRYHEEP